MAEIFQKKGLHHQKKHVILSSVMILYPFFKKYVTILILVTLVLLPAAAGICYWVNLYYPFKIAFLIFLQ